jgi:SAM-dependent methyltransferase
MRTLRQQRAVRHPVFARVYARVGHLMDAEIGDHRRRLLAALTGRVLEVGAGNGLNFPHYPATVTGVLAVEPEPYLRRLALAAASQAPVPIRVVDGTAEAMPAPDGAFDAVVASLVLCTVTDPDQAWAETRRVLRPGGRLRFYEHVRATDPSAGPLAGPAAAPLGVAGRRLPPQPGHGGGHYRRRAAAGPAGPVRPQGHAAASPSARPRGGRARVLARGARKGGTMQTTKPKGPQLVRPGPIGLGIRVILGATVLYWFAALLTKWSGFLERDPIESGRLYTLFTIWWLPEVFALTFRRPWGPWPAVVFLAGGAAIGLAGSLTGDGVWNPALAGWTYAGDLLAWGALAVSFPVAIVTRSPGCELGALPWLLGGRQGSAAPRLGCAVGLDRLDAWEAARRR